MPEENIYKIEIKLMRGKDVLFHRSLERSRFTDIKAWIDKQVEQIKKGDS